MIGQAFDRKETVPKAKGPKRRKLADENNLEESLNDGEI